MNGYFGTNCCEFGCNIPINLQGFEPSEEVSFGATTNPETGAAINKRTSKSVFGDLLMDFDVMSKYLEVLPYPEILILQKLILKHQYLSN